MSSSVNVGSLVTRAGDGSTSPSRVEPAELATVIEIANRHLGLPTRPDEVLASATRVAADTSYSDARHLRALAATCLEHGLSPVVHHDDPSVVSEVVQSGQVVAIRIDEDGASRWLVVGGSDGSPVAVVHEVRRGRVRKRKQSLASLTKTIERRADAMMPLLSLEPRYPLDAIRITEGNLNKPQQALRRLWRMAKLDGDELWMIFVYAVFIGVFTLVTPVAVQALVNTIAFGSVIQPLVILTLALAAGLAFSAVLQALRLYVVEVIQRRIFVRVASDFGRRIPRLAVGVHDGRDVPELVNRFFDVITLQKAGATLAIDALGLLLQTAVGMVLLAFYHPILLAFDALLLLILGAIALMPLSRGVYTAILESKAKFATAAWLQAISRCPNMVSAAASADSAAARTEALCRRYLDTREGHWRHLFGQVIGGLALQVVASVLLLGVGGWLVIDRQLTLGQLVAAELVVASLGAGFGKLGKQLEKLYDASAAADKVGEVVESPRERDGGLIPPSDGPMALDLRQVGHDRLVTRVDLSAKGGARVVVTGDGGSGKSTLISMVAGLRDPSHGSVRLDGLDLAHIDRLRLRQDVCVVSEHLTFLPVSIADNLRFARPSASTDELRAALAAVELEEVVLSLPDGLETVLLPSGAPLSRSQRRRLALARALVQQPRLMLLDGALDGLSPRDGLRDRILDQFLGEEASWTVLIVSDDDAVRRRCGHTIDLTPSEAAE